MTVIGTGNTPLRLVQGVAPRDYFWDAPVDRLRLPGGDDELANVTKEVSPVASAPFGQVIGHVRRRRLDDDQLVRLRRQVAVAHARGIGVRYWDLPDWPVGTRNAVWRTLWDEGVDLLNVDDLDGAARLWDVEGPSI